MLWLSCSIFLVTICISKANNMCCISNSRIKTSFYDVKKKQSQAVQTLITSGQIRDAYNNEKDRTSCFNIFICTLNTCMLCIYSLKSLCIIENIQEYSYTH